MRVQQCVRFARYARSLSTRKMVPIERRASSSVEKKNQVFLIIERKRIWRQNDNRPINFYLYKINFQVKKTHNNVTTVHKLSSPTDHRIKETMYCVRFMKRKNKK